MFVKMTPSGATGLFRRFYWNDSAFSAFPSTTTQLFSQSLSNTLYSCLENFSNTNNFCNFWRINFQQVNTYAFCSWDNIFSKNGIAVLPKTCASTPTPRSRCRPIPPHNGISTCLEATIL